MEMKTFNQDPNFSIVMPGGCNAACDFCFNKQQKQKDACKKIDYILKLWDTLNVLPSQFYQISITGNEPMISPFIEDILFMCAAKKDRYTNILLTTNGTNLLEKSKVVIEGVHHINISRHHYNYAENKNIFKGSWDVTDDELEKIIDLYSKNGIDVSLNCVINDDTTSDFINRYIDYAKKVGAYAVRFRKENGTLDCTPVEEEFAKDYPVIWHGVCPVCRTDLRVIKGLKTYWKSSVLEPSDTIQDEVFELVYAVDGNIYKDWSQQKPIDVGSVAPVNPVERIMQLARIQEATRESYRRTLPKRDHCGAIISDKCGGDSYNSCGGQSSGRC